MSLTQCPNCGAVLPSGGEQPRRCRACGHEAPAGIQAEPDPWPEGPPGPATPSVPGDAFQREERRPWRERDEDLPSIRRGGDWSGVHAGLGLLVIAIITYLICQVLGIVPSVMGLQPGMREASNCLSLLVGVGNLAALIIGLVGTIRTVLAPQESGLRGLGVSSLICSLVGIAFLIGGAIFFAIMIALSFGPRRGGAPPDELAFLLAGVMILGGLLIFVGTLLFFIYLRGVACYFGNPSLGNSFIAYFVVSILVGVALVGGFVLVVMTARGPEALGPVLIGGCVALGAGVALMIWQISLYNQLRSLIADGGIRRPTFPD